MRIFTLCLLTIVFSSTLSAEDIYSLHPRPKEAYLKPGASAFTLSVSTPIFIAPNTDPRCIEAAHLFNIFLKKSFGDTLAITRAMPIGTPSIRLNQLNGNAGVTALFFQLPDAFIPDTEGYVIDVDSTGAAIFFPDTNGAFNALSTLLQLINPAGASAVIPALRIQDEPDYHTRWVFSGHNLLVNSQITDLQTIEDTMFMHKLNGLQQNDFKYNLLNVMHSCCPNYFWNVDTLSRYSAARNIAIIPGVCGIGYSDGILFNDPNLAEGVPATAEYYMQSDTGLLLPDPNVTLPDGNFEEVVNNEFTGWSYYDDPNVCIFVDHSVFHAGATSARCSNFSQSTAHGNVRFERTVQCQPNRYYVLTAWCKTENFSAEEVQLLALGATALSITDFSIPATTPDSIDGGWIQLQVVFNTFDNTTLNLYCGAWGATTGTIWFDDFTVQECGLVNVLRREGAPVTAASKHTGKVYTEGIDYATLYDTVLNNNQGNYPYHSPLTFRLIPGGAIANGDTVSVSFFHPLTANSDNNQEGSVMVCLSEDTLYSILHNQLSSVDSLYHPAAYFMGHDEIRNMNRDSSCLRRNMTPAQLLDNNVMQCSSLIQGVNQTAGQYIWSDMFDSLHNAANDYYFVNGNLQGDWNSLSRALTIVNWNAGLKMQSMSNFANMGFSQITSPYYDDNDTVNIRQWNDTMRLVKNIQGEMYTTWTGDYSLLPPFADYAWNIAPYITHTPVLAIDSAFLANPVITATVLPDPVNNSDSIISVVVGHTTCASNSIIFDTLHLDLPLPAGGGNTYSGALRGITQDCPNFQYFIQATDAHSISKRVPIGNNRYSVGGAVIHVSEISSSSLLVDDISNYPNPFSGETELHIHLANSEELPMMIVTVYDALGRQVEQYNAADATAMDGNNFTIQFHAALLPTGVYYAVLRTPSDIARTNSLIVLR